MTGITLRMFSLLNFKSIIVYHIIDLLLAKEISSGKDKEIFSKIPFLLKEAIYFLKFYLTVY